MLCPVVLPAKPIAHDESSESKHERDGEHDAHVQRDIIEDEIDCRLAGLIRRPLGHIHKEVKVAVVAEAIAEESLLYLLQDADNLVVQLERVRIQCGNLVLEAAVEVGLEICVPYLKAIECLLRCRVETVSICHCSPLVLIQFGLSPVGGKDGGRTRTRRGAHVRGGPVGHRALELLELVRQLLHHGYVRLQATLAHSIYHSS